VCLSLPIKDGSREKRDEIAYTSFVRDPTRRKVTNLLVQPDVLESDTSNRMSIVASTEKSHTQSACLCALDGQLASTNTLKRPQGSSGTVG
jgi:hypothetical protein